MAEPAPVSRQMGCPACGHEHLWLDCDLCPCTAHERTGIYDEESTP